MVDRAEGISTGGGAVGRRALGTVAGGVFLSGLAALIMALAQSQRSGFFAWIVGAAFLSMLSGVFTLLLTFAKLVSVGTRQRVEGSARRRVDLLLVGPVFVCQLAAQAGAIVTWSAHGLLLAAFVALLAGLMLTIWWFAVRALISLADTRTAHHSASGEGVNT